MEILTIEGPCITTIAPLRASALSGRGETRCVVVLQAAGSIPAPRTRRMRTAAAKRSST